MCVPQRAHSRARLQKVDMSPWWPLLETAARQRQPAGAATPAISRSSSCPGTCLPLAASGVPGSGAAAVTQVGWPTLITECDSASGLWFQKVLD